MKKRLFMMLVLASVLIGTADAQHFRDSRYYDSKTDRLDYSKKRYGLARTYAMHGSRNYYGLRVGATFSCVESEDALFDSNRMRTGLNVAAVAGLSLSRNVPLYLETGLGYTEKGGTKGRGIDKMTFNLNYLEVPIVLKYDVSTYGLFGVQPYVGGYLAYGVGGKVKDYGIRSSYSAFGDERPGYPRFQHFDGGLKIGCGINLSAFYADFSYEYGLTNISHNSFDETHNSSVLLTVGVNL